MKANMGNGRYKDIPIVDTARKCGIRFNERTLGRIEVEAACPFCGDKPKRYHLSLNTSRDLYRCNFCGASGNSVSLYARLNNISNAEAARELLEGGNVYQFPPPPLIEQAETELKPLPARHDVYYEMLNHLTLSGKHRNDLRGRGLSDERIDTNMYRTLPGDETARRFLASMLSSFYGLSGVPGFYTEKDGSWSITGKPGLLIPVCDKGGYIQGLQVRLDDEGIGAAAGGDNRKYRWFSSRYKENGAKSGAWVHVTGDTTAKLAYITEGPLKGDAASYLGNNALFICVAGINATEGLYDTVKSLRATELALALDMDKAINKQVREAVDKISEIVSRVKGIKVRPLNWDARYKGIDDYYLALRKSA
jgi:hypothetical protein